jgi:two-component system, chemotaxis family, chemotaxis protein CheY
MERKVGSSVRILVVDDFATMRRIIRNYLVDLGYTNILEADDGKTALPVLQSGQVDLLITDWNMPGMPGPELLREVRRDPTTAKIPVLMVTAGVKREHMVEAIANGADGFVLKPFSVQTLKDEIERILASHKA